MDKHATYAKQNEFNRENYDRLNLMLPKGSKEKLKDIAKEIGVSLNELVRLALTEYVGDIWNK